MLKVLMMLVLLLLVFGVQPNAQTHKEQHSTKGDKPSPTVASVAPQQETSASVQTEDNHHVDADVRVISTPAKDRYDKAAVWINLALALIGACGICAAFVTLSKLERQTKATEDAALATQITVKVMIDSERPWVIAHMVQSKNSCLLDNGNVRFTWSVKNVGKSPAKLIDAGAMVSLDTLGPPIDRIEYKMESLDERILVPGDSLPLFVIWSIVEDGRIRSRVGKTLEEFNDLAIVYGRIRYRGSIGKPDTYETRFNESSTITGGVCENFAPSWPTRAEDIRCT